MKRLICGIGLLVLLVTGLFAQSPKPTAYRDEKFPFSITYDANEWEVIPSSYADGRFRIASKPLMGLTEFNIHVKPPPMPLTDTEFIDLFNKGKEDFLKAFINANIPGTKVLDSGITYIASRKAVYIKHSYVMRNLDDEIELTTYQVQFVYDGYLYLVNYRSPSELFDYLFSDYRDLTSAFVLRPIPPKPNGSIVYRDETFSFSIAYDSNEWDFTPLNDKQLRFQIQNKGAESLYRLRIFVKPPPIPTTEDGLINAYMSDKEAFEKGFSGSVPGTKILGSGTTIIGGKKAVYVKHVLRDSIEGVYFTTYNASFIHGGQQYILILRARTKLFDDVFNKFTNVTSELTLSHSSK
ncbi:MAG: hypothetical protein KF855_17755 [Acidobacteria bacterium]|nr:hypothetical protein [Acidobacteriota bacterium]